jgi:hypothetical protein
MTAKQKNRLLELMREAFAENLSERSTKLQQAINELEAIPTE